MQEYCCYVACLLLVLLVKYRTAEELILVDSCVPKLGLPTTARVCLINSMKAP